MIENYIQNQKLIELYLYIILHRKKLKKYLKDLKDIIS